MSPTPGFRRRDTVSPHPAAFKAVARSCGPNPGKHRRRAKMLRGAPALSRDRNTAVAGTTHSGTMAPTALRLLQREWMCIARRLLTVKSQDGRFTQPRLHGSRPAGDLFFLCAGKKSPGNGGRGKKVREAAREHCGPQRFKEKIDTRKLLKAVSQEIRGSDLQFSILFETGAWILAICDLLDF